jgi:excisionase family DNA binding protein
METLLLNAEDLAQITGFSKPTVYNFFHRSDFPTIRVGRKLVVERTAFHKWLSNQAATVPQA